VVLYQWEKFIENKKPEEDIGKWESKFGPKVLTREKSRASKVRFSVLVDNPGIRIFIIGEFNDWGKKDLNNFELKHDEHHVMCSVDLDCIKHGDKYQYLVHRGIIKKNMPDPAGHHFDDDGNTIFWDFDDPGVYKLKYKLIDTVNRSTRIMQTDLPGLIVHWADKKGVKGSDIEKREYYKFITESGVLEHVKSLGFNTIQFLPFAQSIDGDNWKFRYLVPYQFAVQKNWGTPDDFAVMVDKCHSLGLAVIGDFVIGHLPSKNFRVFGKSGDDFGIHNWVNRHGSRIYMKEETPWGTMRTDFDNKYVRRFIIDSCLHFMKYYRVDGYRIDNVDGIIRYGANGDGDERPNGRRFLRELTADLYKYNPFALMHFESHYFVKDNAKMLVVPLEDDSRALGATAYNSSRMTYYFHREYMPKDVKKCTPWRFKDIADEKDWGQSNSTVADFHNHDAAAGLIPMRATGSYAYDAMTCKAPENHFHAVGKIKVMEGIISFCAEGRTLDLIQSFLLQMGTFEHDSSIQWFLAFNQVSNNMVDFKKAVNLLMDDQAFWPQFAKNRKFLNVDDKNKILVVERRSDDARYVIVVNISGWQHYDYHVGLTSKKDFKVVLNSDLFEYAGSGMISYPKILKNNPSTSFEMLDREIVLGKVAPYQVLVLKEV